MNDSQTTAIVVMALCALVFFLYNSKTSTGESRLKAVVNAITGAASGNTGQATAGVNTALDTSGPNAAMAAVNYGDVNNTGLQVANLLNTIPGIGGVLGTQLVPVYGPNDTGTQDADNWQTALGGLSFA